MRIGRQTGLAAFLLIAALSPVPTLTKKGTSSRSSNVLQIAEPPMHMQKRGRNLQASSFNCTSTVPRLAQLEDLGTGSCILGWETQQWQFYPYDFQNIKSEVKHYVCKKSNKRLIVSNGIPDHAVMLGNMNMPCEKFFVVTVPLNPTYTDDISEPSPAGLIAMALNGVAILGALEVGGGNAVVPTDDDNAVRDAQFWYGHATGDNTQHYHDPNAGNTVTTSDQLLGFALDGFRIFGPLTDDSVLDECNGLWVDGEYRYHVRSVSQVNDALDYCNAGDPSINWKYIIGCYHGDVSSTFVKANVDLHDANTFDIAEDCELDDELTNTTNIEPEEPVDPRPNIIIMQPDDMPFFGDWTPPPNNPISLNKTTDFPNDFAMPYIERLRTQGLEMMQAYTPSPVCGTSRFSTITGKLPSRSATSRQKAVNSDKEQAKVTIPRTKLEDVAGYTNDCSEENLIAVFQANGYRTGLVGKWHLTSIESDAYTYSGYQDRLKDCGFDFAEGLYAENLIDDTFQQVANITEDGQSFSHNMEWVTDEAIKFINADYKDANESAPFILYFNPTVPHSSGNVTEALTLDKFVCTVTADVVNNPLQQDPLIKGMTLEYGGCKPYREAVGRRAGGMQNSNENLGAVWVDDSVGALIHALIDKGIFENTIILFQLDHGIEAKQSLFENGSRIVQFIHYPKAFGTEGKTFEGLVSTVDIAPTMFDFAGIHTSYALDGKSWKDAVDNPAEEKVWRDERCLFFENQFDRAVRCGCGKLLALRGENSSQIDPSQTLVQAENLGYNLEFRQFVDLCWEDGTYVSYPNASQEADNFFDDNDSNPVQRMYANINQCFRNKTAPSEAPDFDTDCSALFNISIVDSNQCQSTADCSENPRNAVCDESVRVCVQCSKARDCPENQVCDKEVGECVECNHNNHCFGGTYCDRDEHVCVECKTAKHCTNNTVNTYCSTETHRCVECKKNKHCELEDTGNRVCDVDVNKCVECKIDSHCANDLYCDKQAKRCVECKNNNHCASNTFKQYCDKDANKCVECLRTPHCSNRTDGNVFCHNTDNDCVACKVKGHCSSGQDCSSEGFCVDTREMS